MGKAAAPAASASTECAIFVKVQAGTQGKTIQVPNPEDDKHPVFVAVPQGAREGQAMLVPVNTSAPPPNSHTPAAAGAMPVKTKAALATSGLLAVGGLAVAGVIMGDVLTGGSMISDIGDGGATIADH